MQTHYYQEMLTTPTGSMTSSIHSMPSTPTSSECTGDIHSGSLTRGLWSETEHEQFLEAMKMFPKGPWRSIAAFIGTRSIKQVQTHAQKYQQKINRRQRGLRKQKKKLVRPEHRVDALASGCITRAKSSSPSLSHAALSSSSLSPRSPGSHVRTSFTRMFSDAMVLDLLALDNEKDISLVMLLEDLEPFPFTDVPCEELFALDDRYHQDLRESMDLLA